MIHGHCVLVHNQTSPHSREHAPCHYLVTDDSVNLQFPISTGCPEYHGGLTEHEQAKFLSSEDSTPRARFLSLFLYSVHVMNSIL